MTKRKITAQDLKLGVQVCRALDSYDRAHCQYQLGRDAAKRGATQKVRDDGRRLMKDSKVFWHTEVRRERYR